MSKLSLSVEPKIKKPRKITRAGLVKRLDKLFSEIVRSRGACEKCGKTTNLQCAHIYGRRHKNLRWDEENALCMCAGCHFFWFHQEPAVAIRWCESVRDFEYLDKKMAETKPMKMNDLFAIEELLITALNDIKSL